METIKLDKDIRLFYTTASSFPAGIKDAHEKLHSMVPFSTNRRYFGLSRPENDAIVYRAAAEELEPGEASRYTNNQLVLPKGKYISMLLHDYMNDLQSIERAFKELLAYPELDPQGYCVEWYLNDKDMRCMIRLRQ